MQTLNKKVACLPVTKPSKARRKLAPGKLPIGILKRLLERYTHTSRSVIVGPAVGIDAAVIDFHGRLLLYISYKTQHKPE